MTGKQRKAKKAKGQRRKLKAQRSIPELKQHQAQELKHDAPELKGAETKGRKAKKFIADGKTLKKKAKSKGHKARKKFVKLIGRHVESHKLEEADRVVLRRMIGHGPLDNSLLASDAELRRVAGVFLGEALVKLKKAIPGLHFYFWTFINDRGNTSDRQPVVDLKGMHSLVDQVFRKHKLASFSVDEFQGLGNYPRLGKGRTIMNGVHAITWSHEQLECEAIMESLNASAVWTCALGADPVHIQPVGLTDGDLRYLSYYMFKSPYEVKMAQTREEGIRLKSTEKGNTPEFAMRLFEGLSQLEMSMIVRSTFDGAKLKADWLRRLTYWHKSRPEWSNDKLPAFDTEEFWRRIRSKKRKVEYGPYQFNR